MKKDKEWLKMNLERVLYNAELSGLFSTGITSSANIVYDDVLNLINQLDEPEKVVVSKMEKVVIPQFVADYIEHCKDSETNNISTTLNYALSMEYESKTQYKNVYDWLHCGKSDRINSHQNLFARAWIDDNYTIEKEPEKLYRVKFPNVTKHGNEMYLEKNDGEDVTSIDWSPKDFVENEDSDDYLFTEQEIEAIDPRYWAFAEEVPNE